MALEVTGFQGDRRQKMLYVASPLGVANPKLIAQVRFNGLIARGGAIEGTENNAN